MLPRFDRRAVLVAIVVHAAVLAYVRSRDPSAPPSTSKAVTEEAEAIDVRLLPAETPAETPPVASVASIAKGDAPSAARSFGEVSRASDEARTKSAESQPHPDEAALPPRADAEGPPEATAPIALVRVTPDQMRLAPAPKTALILADDTAARASSSSVEVAEAKRSVEQSLREGMREQDQKLGLGPEGPIVRALGESTSASLAPITGRAMFSVTIDETGKIARVDLEGTDGDRAGWSDARERAEKLLVGSPVTLRTKGRTAMRLEVQSSFKMPTGHDPGVDVELARIPLSKGDGKKATRIAILDPIPRLTQTKICLTPGASDAPCPVEIPAVAFEITIFRLDGDISNLGAKPRRVVHVHVVENRAL